MRKHRRFGVVIAVLLGTSIAYPPPSTSPHPHSFAVSGFGRLTFQMASANLPARTPVVAAADPTLDPGLRTTVHPFTTRQLLVQEDLHAYLVAHAPRPAPPPPPPPPPPAAPVTTPASGDVWAALRQCESGGNYADNTGNGYYGAYQFSLATWQGIGMTGLPSAAPPAVQDQAARQLQARSGWGQWPTCSRRLNLV